MKKHWGIIQIKNKGNRTIDSDLSLVWFADLSLIFKICCLGTFWVEDEACRQRLKTSILLIGIFRLVFMWFEVFYFATLWSYFYIAIHVWYESDNSCKSQSKFIYFTNYRGTICSILLNYVFIFSYSHLVICKIY